MLRMFIHLLLNKMFDLTTSEINTIWKTYNHINNNGINYNTVMSRSTLGSRNMQIWVRQTMQGSWHKEKNNTLLSSFRALN